MDSVIIKALFLIPVLLLKYSYSLTTAQSYNNTLFATKLLPHVSQNKYSQTVAFSPLAVYNYLGIICLGAKEQSADQIHAALNLAEADRNNFTKNHREFLETSRALHNSSELQFLMDARLFVNKKLNIAPQFKKTLLEYFNTEVEKIDFRDTVSVIKHINGWVENHTENKIKNTVGKGKVESSSGGVLADAIYFKAKWLPRFYPLYAVVNGSQIAKTNAMITEGMFKHIVLPGINVSAIEVPFENRDVSMMVILMTETIGLEIIEKYLEGIDLFKISSKMVETNVTVILPKIRVKLDVELSQILMGLGVMDIFSQNANLNGIFQSTKLRKFSSSRQKVFMDFSEDGIEAAAATLPVFNEEASNQKFENVVPFVFFIRSKNTIYFAGHVTTSV